MKDLMGMAIWDYYHTQKPADILTETSISDIDELPVAYLFRDFDEMNTLEQKALQLSFGKVLDIGAGAGSHSLFLQNNRGLSVCALDFSPLSIEVCKLRGIKNTICADILNLPTEKFDTLLLLMNGTGIFQSLNTLDIYLQKLRTLLASGGQILIDSTDIIYMYDRDVDGGIYIPAGRYYGEVDYFIHYKQDTEQPLKWLYLDYETLRKAAENNGFKVEKIAQEEYSFLTRLTNKAE